MAKVKLAKMSVVELKKEIVRRQRRLPKLIAKRNALDKKIAELQGLGELQAASKPVRRNLGKKRVRRTQGKAREGSLGSTLVEALRAKGKWAIAEAVEAALAAGYKSKSKDFGNIVAMTLSKDKRFRRVQRGIYALKG